MFAPFIDRLTNTPTPQDCFNQYDRSHPNNLIRRENLRLYLEQMHALEPKVMLIAEAPGYRGMRITGVPFSSRAILQDGIEGQPIFGLKRGYSIPEDGHPTAWREATATIVWEVLKDVHPPPIHWNSFPFHPHQPNQKATNRKPRKAEIELGRPFLETMLEYFKPERVIAVGNTAHDALAQIGMDVPKVRHPAQSGKNDFVTGMRELLKT